MSAPSCWNCAHRQAGGITFLGLCRYFERSGKPAKEIPSSVVDAGCRFFAALPEPELLSVAPTQTDPEH